MCIILGSVFNLGMSVHALGPYYNIIHFPKSLEGKSSTMFEKAKIVASIPARWPLNPSYMHTFGNKIIYLTLETLKIK